MTKDKALKLALETLESKETWGSSIREAKERAITAIKEALAQPEQPTIKQSLTVKQEPVLQDIEQYRLQMAGISTAAIGYWKESDGILPDYDTVALRDVAKLYSKYDALYKARWSAQPEQEPVAWMYTSQWKGEERFITRYQSELMTYKADKVWPLYTTPPKREWVGLTDAEAQLIYDMGRTPSGMMEMVESKLKEKNTWPTK